MNFEKFGFHIPNILLPNKKVDYYKWAVVACDQYTSEPEYWEEVSEIVSNEPSTFKLMLPELFLGKSQEEEMIENIRKSMDAYIENGTLIEMPRGCVLVEREAEGRKRIGLIIATDLESYDYNEGSTTLTRATEKTVVERIPPRLKIREGAKIELPHIMILIDDPEKSIIEPLLNIDGEVVYDTDLMLKGGHVKGTFIPYDKLDTMYKAMEKSYEKAKEKYGDGNVIFQAMGDGNHSLATAKANWEKIKKGLSEEEIKHHPARFALCEIENIHDEGIVFEPIHRVMFGNESIKGREILDKAIEKLNELNGKAYLNDDVVEGDNVFSIPYIQGENSGYIIIENPSTKLEVGTLTNALDKIICENSLVEIDYVHGEESVRKLSSNEENVGFLLPAMDKFMLFPAVAADGALPRKTFSMGEANEKRYYIECRYIG